MNKDYQKHGRDDLTILIIVILLVAAHYFDVIPRTPSPKKSPIDVYILDITK